MGKMKESSFELQSEVYLVNGRPCKIWLPPVLCTNGIEKHYWIEYIDDKSITIVLESQLVLTKRGKLLYDRLP